MGIARLGPAPRRRHGRLLTAGGQVQEMVWIPRFTCQSIDPGGDEGLGEGVHPAFIVDGVTHPGFWVGMYPGRIIDGELISQAGLEPTVNQNFNTFNTAARACGTGWHLMTNAEWAAIALWCLKQGMVERGNDQWGRANATSETGRRADGGTPGHTNDPIHSNFHGRTINGSGPDTWRHDNTGEGIESLVGNVWEWVGGLRLDDGDVQILPDNDAATGDLGAESEDWQSLGVHYTAPASGGSTTFNDVAFEDDQAESPDGSTLETLRRLGLAPLTSLQSSRGRVYQTATGERVAFRGGNWDHGANAGWFALFLRSGRSATGPDIGARPAFVGVPTFAD